MWCLYHAHIRVAVPTKDPIVAIACVLFGSREATLPSMGNASFAAAGEGDEDGSGDAEMEPASIDEQPPVPAQPAAADNHEKVGPAPLGMVRVLK